MKRLIILFLLFSTCTNAQVDTFINAKAKETRYINIPQFDYQTNGHAYTLGLTLGANLTDPSSITKIDLVNRTVTKKTLTGTYSHMGEYWNSTYDSAGYLYLPFNTTDYKVRAFNLKIPDSIQITDLGLPFKTDNDANLKTDNGTAVAALAYSSSLGVDKKMYFGAKGDPYVTTYDPVTQQVKYYNAINRYGIDWVLAVTGDPQYIYAVTGQNDSCNLWVISKATGVRRNIMRVPPYTRPTIEPACDGYVYALNPVAGKWYKMVNGDTVNVPTWPGCRVTYYGAGGFTSFFDKVKSRLYWSGNGLNDSVNIASATTNANIRSVFPDKYNPNIIYYVGDYYGGFYSYNISGDSSTLLGITGFNISGNVYQHSPDSFYIPNYPSGTILLWDKRKPWTTGTLSNGASLPASDINANPKIIVVPRSTPMANHHTTQLFFDTTRKRLMLAGLVERTDYTCSIGSCKLDGSDMKAYDANKINSLALNAIAQWRQYWIMSTANRDQYYGDPKLYFYNPDSNIMEDSLSFGFTDYGRIWIAGDQLLGQAGTRFYKINLSTKVLVYDQQGTGAPLCTMLQDATFVIYGGTAPAGWAKTKAGTQTNYVKHINGSCLSINGTSILQTNNIAGDAIDINTAAGKLNYIRKIVF